MEEPNLNYLTEDELSMYLLAKAYVKEFRNNQNITYLKAKASINNLAYITDIREERHENQKLGMILNLCKINQDKAWFKEVVGILALYKVEPIDSILAKLPKVPEIQNIIKESSSEFLKRIEEEN